MSSSESGTHQSACRPAVSLNAAMLISLHSSQQTLITATRSALVTLTFTNELLKLRPGTWKEPNAVSSPGDIYKLTTDFMKSLAKTVDRLLILRLFCFLLLLHAVWL